MKKLHLKITGILLLVLIWTSCEKVVVPDSSFSGIPFGISGKAGNEDLKLGIDQAGVRLVTGAEFVEDSVWEFSGRLESSGTDGRFLAIQLRNRKEGNDSIIQWQPYISDSLAFMQEGGISRFFHQLRVRADNNEGLEIHSIQAGDLIKERPSSDVVFLIPKKAKVPVCVEYGNTVFSGKFCSEVAPQPSVQTPFPNWMVASSNQGTARLMAKLFNGLPVGNFNWANGNQNSEYLIADSTGTYEIRMTDVQDRKFSHSKQLLRDNNTNGFYTYGNSFNFKAEWLDEVELTDKKQLRSVNITYRDKSGEIYRSNRGPQNIGRFNIEEIREYERDGRGRPTLAIKVRFTARLFSQSGDSILLENCHGWFGVGLP